MEEEKKRAVKSYVVRSGRLKDSQRRLLDEVGEKYIIPFRDEQLDLKTLFGLERIIVEIGFGMGAATAELAGEMTDTGFLGIEVYPPGIGRLVREIEDRGFNNIRIIRHDAVDVFTAMINDESLDGIHIFFPDPWPKKRHHKRRLIQRDFAKILTEKLKIGGYLHVATDWEEYAGWILEILETEGRLENSFDGYASSRMHRPMTKFEQKGIDRDHPIRDLYFIRRV